MLKPVKIDPLITSVQYPEKALRLIISQDDLRLFENILPQECKIRPQPDNSSFDHEILLPSDVGEIRDQARKWVALISDSTRQHQQPTFWLGLWDEQAPILSPGAGPLVSRSLAGNLKGSYHCHYLGEIGSSKCVSVYQLNLKEQIQTSFMVGRSKEMAISSRHAQQLIEKNESGIIILFGQSGMGKTLFARHLAQSLQEKGWELITERYFEDHRGGISLEKLAPSTENLSLRERAIWQKLSQKKQPVVWLIDDAQWMPEADRNLILALSRRTNHPCLFLLTSRQTAISTLSQRTALEIELQSLNREDLKTLVRLRLGTPPSDTLLTELVAATNGFPLTSAELVNNWHNTNAVRLANGVLDLPPEFSSISSDIDLQQIFQTRLLALSSSHAKILCAVAMIRGPILLSQLPKFFQELDFLEPPADIPWNSFYEISISPHGLTLDSRHEEIRLSLLELLDDASNQSIRQAAFHHEWRGKNWFECYYHAQFLGQEFERKRNICTVKAFWASWDSGHLKQCLQIGENIEESGIKEGENTRFQHTMGRACYLEGEMAETEKWMRRVSSSRKSTFLRGALGHLFPGSRLTTSIQLKKTETELVADSCHVEADVSWNAKKYHQAALQLILGWLASGSLPRPCPMRAEAVAGLAIISSATPLKQLRNRCILSGLREARLTRNPQTLMRVRMLLAISLLATERWQKAERIIFPAYQWAKQNGDAKLLLQTGTTLCAYHLFCNDRASALDMIDELRKLSNLNTDKFLDQFTLAVSASLVATYRSNAEALRMISYSSEVTQTIPEINALLATLYFSAGDLKSCVKPTCKAVEFFSKYPPTNYGMTTLLEYLSCVVIALSRSNLIENTISQKSLKAFRSQARAFVTARPSFLAWKSIFNHLNQPGSKKLFSDLEKANCQAKSLNLAGTSSMIENLQFAFGLRKLTPNNSRNPELARFTRLFHILQQSIPSQKI